MDTIQELKQRAITLEAKGDDSGALKVYSAIPSDKLEAGLLGRMAAVQVRVGRVSDAVKSHERAAAMLMNEGLTNAAIFAYRQLLQVDPGNAESLLRLGQLSGTAGYVRDAVEAFTGFLEAASGAEDFDALMTVLEDLPPEHRGQIVASLREPLLEGGHVSGERLDEMLVGGEVGPAGGGTAPTAGTRAGGPAIGLIPTGVGEIPDYDPDIAPLEGLETHGADVADLPPILGDLPLLDASGDVTGNEEDAAVTLPGPIPTLDDLDTFQQDSPDVREEGGEEPGDPEEGEGVTDLPLIGFEASPEPDGHPAAASPRREEQGEAGAAPSEEWVDLGAMVLGDDEEDTGGAGARGAGGTVGENEDFAALLEQLGARPSEEAEDVGSHYDLGLAYKEMGLMDAAIGQLHDALAAGDHPLASLEVLGECYLERGDVDLASSVLERATQLSTASDTDFIGVRYLLGRCAEAMGEKEAARESYARVISMEPGFRDAAARLERL